jgi:uncharacterized protein (TIGR03083 family)
MSRRVLDELRGFSDGPFAVLEAFRSQRRRFIETLNSFDAPVWSAPTRCTDWSVHDVVRHVRDVAAMHVASLGDRPAPFSLHEPFQPAKTPAVWLAASAGQPPEETLRELELLIEEEDHLLKLRAHANPSETKTGPLGRTLHWSVSSTHSFWDAWMHERDIALALGLALPYEGPELRLATMYGLLAAAAPAAWSGKYVRTRVLLEGSPDPSYEITHDGDSVLVVSSAQLSAELTGEHGAVLDSLAGRGPEPRKVFGTSSTAVSQLTLLREVTT